MQRNPDVSQQKHQYQRYRNKSKWYCLTSTMLSWVSQWTVTNKGVQCIETCSSIEARACGIAKITSCFKKETASILSKYCALWFWLIFENHFNNSGTVITRRGKNSDISAKILANKAWFDQNGQNWYWSTIVVRFDWDFKINVFKETSFVQGMSV